MTLLGSLQSMSRNATVLSRDIEDAWTLPTSKSRRLVDTEQVGFSAHQLLTNLSSARLGADGWTGRVLAFGR